MGYRLCFLIRKLGLGWGTGLENRLQNRLDLLRCISIGKSLNTIPTLFQPSRAPRIIVGLVRMTIPIEFNNMLSLSADKIHNVRANGMLAAKA